MSKIRFLGAGLIALSAAAGLFWLNLVSYRHAVPAESLRGLAASSAALTAGALRLGSGSIGSPSHSGSLKWWCALTKS